MPWKDFLAHKAEAKIVRKFDKGLKIIKIGDVKLSEWKFEEEALSHLHFST